MNQSAPITDSITTLWRSIPALSTLVPGGLRYGTLKPAARPYAQLNVSLEGKPTFHSGKSYIQRYVVDILVWSNAQVGNAGTIQATMETLLGRDTKLVLAGNATTLTCLLDPAGIEEEAERSAKGGIGQNIFIAGARWIITLVEDKRLASAGTL